MCQSAARSRIPLTGNRVDDSVPLLDAAAEYVSTMHVGIVDLPARRPARAAPPSLTLGVSVWSNAARAE